MYVAHNGTWHLTNGALLVAEHFEIQALLKYQIERRKVEVPSPSLLRKLYLQISLNHMLTTPLLMWLLLSYVKRLGVPALDAALPSVATMALMLAAAHTFNDWGFYWTHRLLHHRALYARFHKQHHEFKGTVGAAAEYAHPFEVVLSNQIPTLGFMLGVGAHPLILRRVARPPPLANVRGAQRLRVWRHARRPLGPHEQRLRLPRPPPHGQRRQLRRRAHGLAVRHDGLVGGLGGRDGYLKSRRADAGRAEAYPVVKGD